MKLEFSRQTFEKYLNIICHENPNSKSRVVPCGPTARQTDMTKATVLITNFAQAPKKENCYVRDIDKNDNI
jgi:hypothetical protein